MKQNPQDLVHRADSLYCGEQEMVSKIRTQSENPVKPKPVMPTDHKLDTNWPTRSVREMKGMLYRKGQKPVTIQQMNEGIARGANRGNV
jgi:hypothetical protein